MGEANNYDRRYDNALDWIMRKEKEIKARVSIPPVKLNDQEVYEKL